MDNSNASLQNPYGFINEIHYPDGGWVQYTWKLSEDASEMTDYTSAGTNLCAYKYQTPVVATRTVGCTASTTALVQTFSYSTTWAASWTTTNAPTSPWSSKVTTLNSSDQVTGRTTQTKYTYLPYVARYDPAIAARPTEYIPLESTVDYYSYNANSTVPTKSITKGWYNESQLLCQVETLDGQSSGTFYEYTHSQVSDTKQYDVGQISSPQSTCYTTTQGYDYAPAPAGPIREVAVTAFQEFDTPLQARFWMPLGLTTFDNGKRISETDYLYDQGATIAVTAIDHDEVGYGSGFSSRGNLTTVTQNCFTSAANCTDATTTYTYDETGQQTSITDPCGNSVCSDMANGSHISVVSYADAYDDVAPTGATNAYPMSVTRPAVNGVAQVSRSTFRYLDGQLSTAIDANTKTTTYRYSDYLNRLKEIDYPDSGVTSITYNDSIPSVTTSQLIHSSPIAAWKISTTIFDGMGHTIGTRLETDPQGTDF